MKTVETRANGRTASPELPPGKWKSQEAVLNKTPFKAGFGLTRNTRTGCLGSSAVTLTIREKMKLNHWAFTAAEILNQFS